MMNLIFSSLSSLNFAYCIIRYYVWCIFFYFSSEHAFKCAILSVASLISLQYEMVLVEDALIAGIPFLVCFMNFFIVGFYVL